MLRQLLGVGVGAGGYWDGFLSKQRIWVLGGGEQLTLRCGLIYPEYEYGQNMYRYVLGLVLFIGADHGMS